jgi:hypothetical protein
MQNTIVESTKPIVVEDTPTRVVVAPTEVKRIGTVTPDRAVVAVSDSRATPSAAMDLPTTPSADPPSGPAMSPEVVPSVPSASTPASSPVSGAPLRARPANPSA